MREVNGSAGGNGLSRRFQLAAAAAAAATDDANVA